MKKTTLYFITFIETPDYTEGFLANIVVSVYTAALLTHFNLESFENNAPQSSIIHKQPGYQHEFQEFLLKWSEKAKINKESNKSTNTCNTVNFLLYLIIF